eukprot:CAMPEP_0171136734 /NCGR_PEP_ID=MMETSP0766_2-20121228/132037_1 /TAXON_ID=439317 /ORGANISM="Gambierdiscus australes, Strain CAWD 149" /LENGTH=121 /DNA_ID=CAMNT_0011600287 /DNA_START=179 /DNA_END=541 /DNA_ORIENTATION=-
MASALAALAGFSTCLPRQLGAVRSELARAVAATAAAVGYVCSEKRAPVLVPRHSQPCCQGLWVGGAYRRQHSTPHTSSVAARVEKAETHFGQQAARVHVAWITPTAQVHARHAARSLIASH